MKQKALVLLNMGGPNNLDEVKLFLSNMFNDKNIITVKSSLLRRFIAVMITTSRTKKAQANYAKLGGKSPLVGYTQQLVDKLQKVMPDYYVSFAMRYTPPFCEGVIRELQAKGIDEVVLLPLYPHYSTTTTKSSVEDFMDVAKLFIKIGEDDVVDFEKAENSDFLSDDFSAKDVALGHSYFIADKKKISEDNKQEYFNMKMKYEVIPILNEYLKDGVFNEKATVKIKEIEQRFA